MKIKFLGTSHGVPMPNRHCQSILVETGDELYLFDAGAPVMNCLINEGYDLTKLKAVFITHAHTDHLLGLINMVDLASWYYKDMSFEVFVPEQRCIDAVIDYNKKMLPNIPTSEKITFTIYNQGRIFDNGKLAVTAFHTDHMEQTSNIAYGFLIEAEGKRIYQTGDMHGTLRDFPSELLSQKTDAVISECAHFNANSLIEKLNGICAEKVMVVHVFPLDNYDVFKEYAKTAPFELLLPNDGDEYTL